MIEFLDYCENFKKSVKNNSDLNDFLYRKSRIEYFEIVKGKEKINSELFYKKFSFFIK
jgi:thioredoxin-related protein